MYMYMNNTVQRATISIVVIQAASELVWIECTSETRAVIRRRRTPTSCVEYGDASNDVMLFCSVDRMPRLTLSTQAGSDCA